MINRLDVVFKKSPVLALYTVVGYPTSRATAEALEAAVGADIIELGMPFSDPVADGPVIQRAHFESLKNGTTMTDVFHAAKMLKDKASAVVLMGYLNPVLAYGIEQFVRDAHEAGVDGVILPDLPPEEFERSYEALFTEAGIYPIFLVSPNSSEARIKYVDSLSKGFLYAVSSLAITGATLQENTKRDAYLARLAALNLRNPVMVGFGIASRDDFRAVTAHANGAIVGSAFVKLLGEGATRQQVLDFIGQFR